MEELVHSIFHPPEYLIANFIPQGMEGKKQLGTSRRTLAQELLIKFIKFAIL